MTTIALPGEGQGSRYRILGWGASALLHGGALAFFLYGLPHSTMPPPAPEIIPLEMAAAPSAPQMEASEATPAMEEAQAVAPQATTAAQVPPPPLAMTAPEAATPVEPPPDTMAATPPEAVEPPPVEAAPTPPMETLQAVEPEPQRPPEPDVVPLEAADIPPPPPAPPPPPVQARPPAPTPPRPAPTRREPVRPAPSTAPVEAQAMARQAPPGPATAAPPPAAAPSAAPSRAVAAPPVNYISMVSAALNRAKRYPQRARLRRIEGTAMLSFTMRRDGSVVNWRIVRSAGDPDLDEAVGEMIERASLPPLPDSIPGEIWAPTVAISFSIR